MTVDRPVWYCQPMPAPGRKTLDQGSARERLLAAANELFYSEGVHTVGIDRVIKRAGVAKASLYNTFGSKDELVRSYLSARRDAQQARITRTLAEYDNPRDRMLGVFDMLDEVFAEPGFRGCAFMNASAEAKPGDVVETVCESIRAWIRGLFTDLAREARVGQPEVLAQQLVLLYDGATVSARLDHNQSAARSARSAAAAMIDLALAA
ncbi:MAG: TetR/AcrR family transcriptional regulator [Frankiales bacterium]|nr:TetR/AcrR family transcriptional regulator [Frankiales bacterium]